jgi:hypothetical protein
MQDLPVDRADATPPAPPGRRPGYRDPMLPLAVSGPLIILMSIASATLFLIIVLRFEDRGEREEADEHDREP